MKDYYLCRQNEINMENPFVFGAATSGKWFTDRKEDTQRLLANFTHGINTILISPRRWGKTSLVYKVANLANSKNFKVVNMDIFSCRSEEDFYRIFATEVIKQTAQKWEEWLENAKHFLASLVPKISIGADPVTDFSLSFDFSNKNINEEILNLPQKIALEKDIQIVICIDEFQQISEFPDAKTFQKKLRSFWQLQINQVSYCLYGSKKHLMHALFSKQSMPFYKFGDVIFLQKIAITDWIRYIQQRFEETGKSISSALAERICLTVENHSSYVQQFSWLVWIKTEEEASTSDFEEALKDLLNQNSLLYYNYVEKLTKLQLNFLRAVAHGIQDKFSRKEIISSYGLGTSANIARVRKSLEERELIDISPRSVTFNDPVFRLWFKKELG
jgi:hypothetical protein